MMIRYRCPKCGKDHASEDATAGQMVACTQCNQPMKVPGAKPAVPSGPAAASQSISFRCPGCGTSYSTGKDLAGKKVRCKSCGQGVRIPGPTDPAVPTPTPTPTPTANPRSVRRPSAAPAPAPATAGPSIQDIFGLDEPATAPSGSNSTALPSGRSPSGGPEVEGPLPPRPAAYEPLTAAKKKKIAKRAARVEKERPTFSGAGLGLSFGGILTAALIGWRVYRVVNSFNRPPRGGGAFVAGPNDFNNTPPNPRAASEDEDRQVAEMLRQPGSAEARDWLDGAKHPNHAVAEMGADAARLMVAGYYQRGAKRVSILDPIPVDNAVMSAMLSVELPADPSERKKCLEWQARYLKGEPPTTDFGQKYLLISTE